MKGDLALIRLAVHTLLHLTASLLGILMTGRIAQTQLILHGDNDNFAEEGIDFLQGQALRLRQPQPRNHAHGSVEDSEQDIEPVADILERDGCDLDEDDLDNERGEGADGRTTGAHGLGKDFGGVGRPGAVEAGGVDAAENEDESDDGLFSAGIVVWRVDSLGEEDSDAGEDNGETGRGSDDGLDTAPAIDVESADPSRPSTPDTVAEGDEDLVVGGLAKGFVDGSLVIVDAVDTGKLGTALDK
jgi:hypothetical protein